MYNDKNEYMGEKRFYTEALNNQKSLNQWIIIFKDNSQAIGLVSMYPSDFQNNSKFSIRSHA